MAAKKLIPNITERLFAVGLNQALWQNLKRSVQSRTVRESIIPEDEIASAISQIISFPTLGSGKGALKLQLDEKAVISPVFYNEAKKQLEEAVSQEHTKRKKCELEKNCDKRKKDQDSFTKQTPSSIHQVWSTDFTEVKVLGFKFVACVVYELYSGAYLAIEAGLHGDANLAVKAFEAAINYAKTTPLQCLLSDNGREFLSNDFQQVLNKYQISHMLTPPGEPWYNGALESGNKDLKKHLYTKIAQKIADHPALGKRNVDLAEIEKLLQQCCHTSQHEINHEIPRLTHKSTPHKVLNKQVAEQFIKRTKFQKKQQERRIERMKKIKNGKTKPRRKSFVAKAAHTIKKHLKGLTNDHIFTLTNLLRGNLSIVQN